MLGNATDRLAQPTLLWAVGARATRRSMRRGAARGQFAPTYSRARPRRGPFLVAGPDARAAGGPRVPGRRRALNLHGAVVRARCAACDANRLTASASLRCGRRTRRRRPRADASSRYPAPRTTCRRRPTSSAPSWRRRRRWVGGRGDRARAAADGGGQYSKGRGGGAGAAGGGLRAARPRAGSDGARAVCGTPIPRRRWARSSARCARARTSATIRRWATRAHAPHVAATGQRRGGARASLCWRRLALLRRAGAHDSFGTVGDDARRCGAAATDPLVGAAVDALERFDELRADVPALAAALESGASGTTRT